MSLIEWDAERFSVSHSGMDEQHKTWIGLINRLHDSLLRKGEYMAAEDAVREILDYTVYHFAEEERLMREKGFPGYAAHKQLHEDFVAEARAIAEQLREGNIVLRSQIMSMLVGWFEDHILTKDKQYAEFVAD